MRYAVISDVHANLQAWKAVLLDIRSSRVDGIVCLGDMVGYGPDPAAVLEGMYAGVDHFVLGNHDAVVCGKLDAGLFNDRARKVIEWTRTQLSADAVRFIAGLPLTLAGDGFRCSHGEFSSPAAFRYLIEPPDAAPSWATVAEPLLFVGHTHKPGIFVLGASGTPHLLPPQDFTVEEGKRFIVNVGSVGQPRDGDTRACYCIYDCGEPAVYWRRIPFDIDAYREALAGAGVSPETSYFLGHDPRLGTPPLRDLLNFSPARTRAEEATGAVEVRAIQLLRKKLSRWRRAAALGLAAAAGVALAAGVGLARHMNRATVLRDPGMRPASAITAGTDANILAGVPRSGEPGAAFPGWSVRLGNRHRQHVGVLADAASGVSAFVAVSETARDGLRLCSPPIRVKPGMKLRFEALFKKSDDFLGTVAVVISVDRQTGERVEEIDQFIVKEPNEPRRDGWVLSRRTFETPAGASSLSFQVRGRFTGSVLLRDLRLVRKE